MDNNATTDTSHGRSAVEKCLLGVILFGINLGAIVGNVMIMVAVSRIHKRRSSITNYFIVSLACADLMVSILVIPFSAVFEVIQYWPFGAYFCDIYQAIDILSATASILNLCVISLDRYMAITSPFTYYRRMNNRTAAVLITTVWVVSCLIGPLPVYLNLHEDYELRQLGWYSTPTFCVLAMNATFALVSSMISFYIPSVIILFTYARIYVVASRQARQISAHDVTTRRLSASANKPSQRSMARERKAAKTLAMIIGAFIACWLPFFVANIIQPFCGRCIAPVVFTVFVWLGYCNSLLNPFIYSQNNTFRNVFKSMLLCNRCRGIAEEISDLSHSRQSNSKRPSLQRSYDTEQATPAYKITTNPLLDLNARL